MPKTKPKQIKAWMIVNKQVNFNYPVPECYFGMTWFDEKHAKRDFKETKSKDLRIIAVLITLPSQSTKVWKNYYVG